MRNNSVSCGWLKGRARLFIKARAEVKEEMELVLIRSNILHIKQQQSVETLLKLLLLIEDLHHDFLWFCNSGFIRAILWWNCRFSPLTNHLICFPSLLSILADQPEVSVRSAAFFFFKTICWRASLDKPQAWICSDQHGALPPVYAAAAPQPSSRVTMVWLKLLKWAGLARGPGISQTSTFLPLS